MPDKGDLGLGAVSSLIGVCEVKAPLQPFIPVSHSLLSSRLARGRHMKSV